MSAYDKTGEQMLQIDHKRLQKEQNYRRAEAFLLWKFGPAYDDVRRFLKGSGVDWPSLFVEFLEVVEKDLLARMSDYEEAAYDRVMTEAMCNPKPQFIHLSEVGEVTEEMAKAMADAPANPTLKFDHWSTEKSADGFFKSPLMGYAGEARKPMRRHWKDDPGAYTPEELKKLKEALKDLRIRFVGLFNSYVRKTYHENSNPDNDLELALFDTDAALESLKQKEADNVPRG